MWFLDIYTHSEVLFLFYSLPATSHCKSDFLSCSHSKRLKISHFWHSQNTEGIVCLVEVRLWVGVCVSFPVKLLRHDSPGRSSCSCWMNSLWLSAEYVPTQVAHTHTCISVPPGLKTGNNQEIDPVWWQKTTQGSETVFLQCVCQWEWYSVSIQVFCVFCTFRRLCLQYEN